MSSGASSAELTGLGAGSRDATLDDLEHEFRRTLVATLFGTGDVVVTCNATLGLVLAIAQALHRAPWTANVRARRRYALVPAFTSTATIHAVLWNRLTPLFVDIDAETWLPAADAEDRLLAAYAGEIALVLPCATFGNPLDLDRYLAIGRHLAVPVVVNAPAGLGSLDAAGRPFGAGRPLTIVYSVQDVPGIGSSEAGLVYSADTSRVRDIGCMANFGHDQDRLAVMPGLHARLPGAAARMCLQRLDGFDHALTRRAELASVYAAALSGCTGQRHTGRRVAYPAYPVLVPEASAAARDRLVTLMRETEGIDVASPFSPHAAEHPHFHGLGPRTDLEVTRDVARRIVSLPLDTRLMEEGTPAVAVSFRRAMNRVGQAFRG